MNIGFIFAMLASVTWGITYALDQKILEKISPMTLNSIFYFISFIITIPFLFYNKQDHWIFSTTDKKFIYILLTNVVLACVANFFITSGIKNLNASTASIIEITYPLFVVFFSMLIFKTIPNYLFFIRTFIVMFGIILIIKSAN